MISVLSPEQAISKLAGSVFLHAETDGVGITDELLSQVVRRALYIMAPCGAHELARAVLQSFPSVELDGESLADRIDRVVESLIVYGDILEMRGLTDQAWSQGNSFVLRPAPPSFVVRRNSSVAVLGIAGEQITPLTGELESRVVHRGVLRIIPVSVGEDMQGLLRELGLLKLPERTWLRLPAVEPAATHISSWRQLLAKEPAASPIDGLQILDTSRSPTFYRDRWCNPESKHEGLFIARRPQRYGANLWSLVELERGVVKRFKDLTVPGDRLRPFDIAWRIQAAFDAVAGSPQRFGVSELDASTHLVRFYSPIPSWCERHLSIVGQKAKADRCLFSFEIPTSDLGNEIKLLQEALWMTENSNKSSGETGQ
jgi:hypothetical protein